MKINLKNPLSLKIIRTKNTISLLNAKGIFLLCQLFTKKTPGKIIWDNEFKLNHIYIFINITSKKIVNRNSFVNNVIFFVSWK